MVFLPTLILVIIQIFLLSIFVKNFKYTENKNQILLVIIITLILTVWTSINTLLLPDFSDSRLLKIHEILNIAGYFVGAVSIIFIYLFSYYFPVERETRINKQVIFFPLFITPFLSFSSYISGGYYLDQSKGIYVYQSGDYFILYGILVAVLMMLFLKNLLSSYTKFESQIASQTKTVGIGLALTALFALLFIVILPAILGDVLVLYSIGYISPAFFVISLSIAMIRHKLFDIKSYVARATTYLVLVIVLFIFYMVFGFGLSRYIRGITDNELIGDVSLFVTSILVAAFYIPLKKWFNRLTNKIFFRDIYDPQSMLSELNKSLVGDSDIERLLTNTASILKENFKISYCTFYIRSTSYFPNRFLGSKAHITNFKQFDALNDLSKILHKKIHYSGIEPKNQTELQINNLLKSFEVEVLARLVSTTEYEVNGIGYIFFGPKKGGSQFTASDLKLIEIVVNELVIAIQNALRYEEIEQFNVTLQKKIDEATNELKRSNDKLKALDEAKDEFVSMASHQLRTPLTSIKGYISMVLEEDAGKINPTQKQMLGQAMFSSQRMVYLISDLLNVSRLKTGKFIIEAKPVYLPDLVESELSQLYDGASAKNITLSYEKPKKFTMMNLDDMKIRQVVMNFTDNAIYYTPNGGKITLTLKDKKDSVEFTVKDTGIGVPKNEQHKLFAKFYRADNARKARPDGTGLGLFMAKKVIIAQGGSLLFSSKEGKGSTFGFSFPKDKLEIK